MSAIRTAQRCRMIHNSSSYWYVSKSMIQLIVLAVAYFLLDRMRTNSIEAVKKVEAEAKIAIRTNYAFSRGAEDDDAVDDDENEQFTDINKEGYRMTSDYSRENLTRMMNDPLYMAEKQFERATDEVKDDLALDSGFYQRAVNGILLILGVLKLQSLLGFMFRRYEAMRRCQTKMAALGMTA